MYSVSFNPYEMGIDIKDNKKIVIDGKEIILSVGSTISSGDDFKATLNIDVYYDKNSYESLTDFIPQLNSFDNKIAINLKFKNQNVIAKLRELGILSETVDKVKYGKKEYEIVTVNLEELKLYKPVGDAILKNFEPIITKEK